MFVDFFYHMRERGLPVSITEWLTLISALSKGHGVGSLDRFYSLCRSVCIKSETHFDLYDQCFAEHFQGVEAPEGVLEEILQWLQGPKGLRDLSPQEIEALKQLDLDELRREFEKRLQEQKGRHDGGNRWIGTGGTSPFGNSGYNPGGVRIGGGGGNRSAVQIASERRFQNLRNDVQLDVRQIGMALRQLRRLGRDGPPDILDLDGTIDKTARDGGEIDLVFEADRKNTVKLLLLMDVGGSMNPYTRLCERLFSAAHGASHFQRFRYFYFHNCPYEMLFTDYVRGKGEPTGKVIQELDESWICFVVGDAAMAPYELTARGGAIDYWHDNPEPGLTWLQRLKTRIPRTVWLNPDPERYWNGYSTTMIRSIFEMYPLTVGGLKDAVSQVRRAPN